VILLETASLCKIGKDIHAGRAQRVLALSSRRAALIAAFPAMIATEVKHRQIHPCLGSQS
jgi:hypothetical protein